MLIRALERSARRFAGDAESVDEVIRNKRGRPRIWSDEEIEAAVSCAASLSEASRLSGISTATIHNKINRASKDSCLAAFKGKFQRGGRRP